MRVSVIIPVFNGQSVVARAIDSALAQDLEDVEVIVVNDGSTDGTAEILERYHKKIKIITQDNRGPAWSRNAGMRAAESDYLAFLDADDSWLPEKLRKTTALLDANPEAVLAFSAEVWIDEKGMEVPVSPHPWRDLSLQQMLDDDGWWMLYPSAVVLRKQVLLECGGFSHEFTRPGFEDPYAWLMMRERGPFVYTSEPLVIYQAPDFAAIADKYSPGRRTYFRLVRGRYGRRRSRNIIKATNRLFASSLAAKAFSQMREGQHAAAFNTWLRVHWYNPAFAFTGGNLRRMIRPNSVRAFSRVLLARLGFRVGRAPSSP